MLRLPLRFALAAYLGAGGVLSLAYEPYLPNVTSLVEITSNNNGYFAVDQIGNTLTNSGVVVGSAKEGNYGYFNGGNYLSTPASTDFNFGSNSFTIEGWFLANGTGGAQRIIQSYNQSINSCSFGVTLYNGLLYGYLSPNDVIDNAGNKNIVAVSNSNVVAGKWHHFAFVRNGDSFQLYVNGVATGAPVVSAITHQPQNHPVFIGARYLAGTGPFEYFNGFIDSLRITKGVARYTGNFTPTTFKFDNTDASWGSVVLAMNFETGMVDLKSHAFANNAGVLRMIPGKFDNGIMYFRGAAGVYAGISSTPGTAFASTDDFTVEMLVNMPTVPAGGGMVLASSTANGGLTISAAPSGIQVGRSFVGFDHTFSTIWSANQWYHIAVVRKNGVLSVFKDGVLLGQSANTFNYPQGVTTLGIGGDYSWLPYAGFICGYRVTKGLARYEVSLPVANAFTSDANTLSLLHFDSDAGLVDLAPSGPSWQSVGSAALSGTQKLFGASSLFVPAAGSGIKATGFNWNIGTGDYTFEFSWYNTAASDSYIFDTSISGSGNRAFLLNSSGGSTIQFVDSYGSANSASITFNKPTLNAWHHFAAVRKNGIVVIYIDGVVVGTGTSTISLSYTGITLGGYLAGMNYSFIGYYDEFRVSNVARYVQNVPTSALSLTSETMLLLKGEGAHGSTALIDELGATVNRTTATISTAEKKWGNSSIVVPGNGSIQVPGKTLGSGDFTIEGWFKAQSGIYLFDIGSPRLAVFIESNKVCVYTSGYSSMASIPAPTFGAWHHFAIVRKNGMITAIVDGIPGTSGVCTSDFTSATWNIGNDNGGNQQLNGYLDDIRISNKAMYNPGFATSTTIPTEAFKDDRAGDYYWDSVTSFMSSTPDDKRAQSYGFSSGVTVDNTVQLFGQSTIKFNSGNIFVSGDGRAVGTGNFTWESWIYPTSIASDRTIFDSRIGNAAGLGLYCSVAGVGKLSLWNPASNLGTGATVIPVNKWSHVAMSKIGSTVYVFLDGKLEITATDSQTHAATQFWYGSSSGTNQFFQGNMSNIRYTTGIGRYKASFSAPVGNNPVMASNSDPWASSNQLLMHCDGSAVTDVTGKSITLNGTAGLTTDLFRLGDKSLRLGDNAWASLANSTAWDFTTSDASIELWAYLPTGFGFTALIGQSNGGSDGNWFTYAYPDGRICIGRNGISEVTSAYGAIVGGQWNHIAITRVGTITAVYVNGIKVITSAVALFNASGNPLIIGPSNVNLGTQTWYADEIRITKSISRYLNNFSIQTGKFPDAANAPTFDLYQKYTKFALNGDSLVDGINGISPAQNGSPVVSTASSATGEKAIYLNGSSRLDYAGSTNFVFNGDFTIETWVNKTGTVGGIVGTGDSTVLGNTNGSAHFAINVASSQITVWLNSGSPTMTFNTAANYMLNGWHHLALTRVGSTVYLLLDGVVVATTTYAGVVGYSGSVTSVGGLSVSTYYFNGYVQGMRITKDASRYKGNLIAPRYKLPLAA